MDDIVLIVSLLLCSSGFWAEGTNSTTVAPADVRLVGGASHCTGHLEQKYEGAWETVYEQTPALNMTMAAAVCRQLYCGSVVAVRRTGISSAEIENLHPPNGSRRSLSFDSNRSGFYFSVEITCSDSVRLVDGNHWCSGRLEVKSNQTWSSVCEDGFDLKDAEVICEELRCGAPSFLQGALYEEAETPVRSIEFQCKGDEFALLDCDGSVRNTCSSGKAVGLSCTADTRLVGGTSRCSGMLEMHKRNVWGSVDEMDWNLRLADGVCGELQCGSAVSIRRRRSPSDRYVWKKTSGCAASSLMECLTGRILSSNILEITCSDSVRLVDGTHLCSGRLEVKSNQSWSSVCADDFGLQEAEVVCRELRCGAPSVFRGEVYVEAEAPAWMRKFQCDGNESAVLDCRSSTSTRNTCSLGKAVGLTCSDPDEIRLVGGSNRCSGRVELKHSEEWRVVNVIEFGLDLKVTTAICQKLDCGSPVSVRKINNPSKQPVWWVNSLLILSESRLMESVTTRDQLSDFSPEITCSDSVRLVDGTKLCSGRLEVKSNQSWSSVCADGFGLQEAEVVCRQLGCGAPSVLTGGLYVEAEALVQFIEFQCDGHESALLDCGVSSQVRNTCSSRKAVGLTCSEPTDFRLVGEKSRCAGTLELKYNGEWRSVADWDFTWDKDHADIVCRLLDCGSALSAVVTDSPDRLVWWIKSSCVISTSALLECVILTDDVTHYTGLKVICSDLLAQPNIYPSPSTSGVFKAKQQGLRVLIGSNFTIICSVTPQYQGGSFQLVFTTSSTAQNYTLPAVNHSAHFLFFAADHTHIGDYRCVYRLDVFSHNFSSESQPLHVIVLASITELMVRLAVLLLGVSLLISALCFHSQACRIQKSG